MTWKVEYGEGGNGSWLRGVAGCGVTPSNANPNRHGYSGIMIYLCFSQPSFFIASVAQKCPRTEPTLYFFFYKYPHLFPPSSLIFPVIRMTQSDAKSGQKSRHRHHSQVDFALPLIGPNNFGKALQKPINYLIKKA